MAGVDAMGSPMTMTLSWEEVFRRLDQWSVVEKLRDLHAKSNAGTSPTGFVRFGSPDIAHLVVDTQEEVRLFHHFHHDVDDGLNDGTNAQHSRRHGRRRGTGKRSTDRNAL